MRVIAVVRQTPRSRKVLGGVHQILSKSLSATQLWIIVTIGWCYSMNHELFLLLYFVYYYTLNGQQFHRSKHPKAVLIMDEVDGMSAGDRGGVADLIASIKISKIPIICICNDRYSQKLKSLVNYCLMLNFRKPTKQQVFFFVTFSPSEAMTFRITDVLLNYNKPTPHNLLFAVSMHAECS